MGLDWWSLWTTEMHLLKKFMQQSKGVKGDGHSSSPARRKENSLASSSLQIMFIKKAQMEFLQNVCLPLDRKNKI